MYETEKNKWIDFIKKNFTLISEISYREEVTHNDTVFRYKHYLVYFNQMNIKQVIYYSVCNFLSLCGTKGLFYGGLMSGIKIYDVSNLERINCRSGSDGYQAKYYAENRTKFIKTQAMLSGVLMRDWQVEIIASKICDKLDIYSVKQFHCKVSDGIKVLDAIVSDNFELEGFDYISFETLLNRLTGESTHDSRFIKMSTLDKMEFCSKIISKACSINIKYALKYMLDLAVIDIIVGNTDRHTKNFGVFWDINNQKFKIARIFDNGMGLFENDSCRDSYKSIEDRMRNLYIEPYGEDPFDLIDIIKSKININNIYNFKDIRISDYKFPNNDSKLYFKEVIKRLGK